MGDEILTDGFSSDGADLDDDGGSYLIDITDEKDKTVRNLSTYI